MGWLDRWLVRVRRRISLWILGATSAVISLDLMELTPGPSEEIFYGAAVALLVKLIRADA